MHVIGMALSISKEILGRKTVIVSDSKSDLSSLLGSATGNALVERLRNNFHISNKAGIIIELFWIPEHVGIKGNEMADHHVKHALSRPAELISVKQKLKEVWEI